MTSEPLQFLSRYLQFDTTRKNEMDAAQWLAGEIRERGLTQDVTIHEPAPGRGLVIAKIAGSEPLRPLIVNHHIDVVVADPAQWSHPPFGGEIADNYVYGRGALDDKGMGVVFLFALQELVAGGARFRRPIIFTAVPDEETHGQAGTGWLVKNLGAELNPEWVWDEGGAGLVGVLGPRTYFGLATCEKQVHLVKVTAKGKPGHGSMPHGENPNDRLIRALRWVLNNPRPFRLSETTRTMFATLAETQTGAAKSLLERIDNPVAQRVIGPRLQKDAQLNAFVRDTISVNVIRGGEQANVIPETAEALLDCRLLPGTDPDEFDGWLKRRLGNEVTFEVLGRSPRTPSSPLDSPFYHALREAALATRPDAGFFPMQMSGATDGRFWREAGFPAYGMSPFLITREDIASIHGIDERVSGENLAFGIKLAKDVISRVCL